MLIFFVFYNEFQVSETQVQEASQTALLLSARPKISDAET